MVKTVETRLATKDELHWSKVYYICHSIKPSGILGRDLHKVFSHPILKEDFQNKIDFEQWDKLIRDNEVDVIPLIKK